MHITSGLYGQAVTQLRGLGGIGKSLLAREYAIRFGRAYPGGVFWINAYGHGGAHPMDGATREASRQDQLRAFSISLGIRVENLAPDEIESAFWRHLEQDGRPCLWIADDVPSEAELEPAVFQTRWIARWSGGSTLVTTRGRSAGALGSQIDLGVLSESEALELLTRARRPTDPVEQRAAVGIASELGYHPLAIEVAGSYLATAGQGFQQYLDELRNPHRDAVELGAELKESLPTGHERSVSRTLLKSLSRLGREGTDLLRLASVLAVEPLPVGLVAGAFDRTPETGLARLAASSRNLFGLRSQRRAPERRLAQALDQVDSLGLCQAGEDGSRAVHVLVSRTMRYYRGDDTRTRRLRTAAVNTLAEALQVVEDIRQHTTVAREIAHARHLVGRGIASRDEAELANWLARYDYERGDYAGASRIQQEEMDARRRLLGADHPDTLVAIGNLALTLYFQGKLAEARALQEPLVEAARRVLGTEHRGTRMAMNNLGLTLLAQGDFAAARTLHSQVLETSRRVLGNDHADTLLPMINLAYGLLAVGRAGEARTLQEETVRISRSVLGEAHPRTLTAMNNLALTRIAQGDLAGGRQLQEELLKTNRSLLGEDHPTVVTLMGNLAVTLTEQGDLAARPLGEEALERSRRILGDDHPNTLLVMGNLGGTLHQLGELDRARTLQQHVLDARRRLSGEDHPETLRAMNNLAEVLDSQGEQAAGLELHREVLEKRQQLFGPEHPDTLEAMNNLAAALIRDGDLAAARALFETVLEASRRILGPRHSRTSMAAHNLTMALRKIGDDITATEVTKNELLWLTGLDPADLSLDQRRIRQLLLEHSGGQPQTVPPPPTADV
jgi:tetratricopeptide (TPR) repeat protein